MLGAIDATSKHREGQSRVEAEVEERVPAFPADPDGTAGNRDFTLKISGSEKNLEIAHLVHSRNSRTSVGLEATHPKDRTMGKMGNWALSTSAGSHWCIEFHPSACLTESALSRISEGEATLSIPRAASSLSRRLMHREGRTM